VAAGEAITAKDKEDEDEEDKELAESLAKLTTGKDKAAKKSDAMDTDETEGAEDIKGVPQFWLTALRNHPQLQTSITERDEEALAYLSDLRYG
jgi:nucleosome assembly protein 1-like 1